MIVASLSVLNGICELGLHIEKGDSLLFFESYKDYFKREKITVGFTKRKKIIKLVRGG